MPGCRSRTATSLQDPRAMPNLTRGVIQLVRLGPFLQTLTSKDRACKCSSRDRRLSVIQILGLGKELDPLVDGAPEVLEGEGIDPGVRGSGGRFLAELEGRMRWRMSIDVEASDTGR